MPVKEIYPWDLWFDGNKHILQKGVDYGGKTLAFSKYIYSKITERGLNGQLKVQISDDRNSVIIDLKKEDKEESKNELVVRNNEVVSTNKYRYTELADNVLRKLDNKKEIELIYLRDYTCSKREVVEIIYEVAKRQGTDISLLKWKPKSNGVVFYVEEIEYKFEEWFNKLNNLENIDWNQLVEELIYDDEGQPIKLPTGKFKTELVPLSESKHKPTTPDEVIELKYPKDFRCTPRKMAANIQDEADDRNIDTSKWYFDYASERDTLKIYCGRLAEKKRLEDADKNQIKLFKDYLQGFPNADQVSEWVSILKKDGLVIIPGKDFKKHTGEEIAEWIRYWNSYLEFDYKVEKDENNKAGEKLGWKTLVLTIRKPMITRAKPGMEGWHEFVNSDQGKFIEQQYIEDLKLDQEGRLLEDPNFAKRQYIEKMCEYNEELRKIEMYASDNIKDSLKMEVESQIKILKEEFKDKLELSYDELLKLEDQQL